MPPSSTVPVILVSVHGLQSGGEGSEQHAASEGGIQHHSPIRAGGCGRGCVGDWWGRRSFGLGVAGSSSPIIMSGGGGYGNANQVSYNDGVLQSWLKDTVLDGQRVYVNGYADYGSYDFPCQSGRRTDGGSSYARMADKSFTSAYPYGVAQYRYSIELCRDKPLIFDPCSEDKRGWHSGL